MGTCPIPSVLPLEWGGGVRRAMQVWVHALGRGTISPWRLQRLLGQLCWLSKPGAGLSCFMVGCYRAMNSDWPRFTRGMARSPGIVLLFNSVAQRYPLGQNEGCGKQAAKTRRRSSSQMGRGAGVQGGKMCRSLGCKEVLVCTDSEVGRW